MAEPRGSDQILLVGVSRELHTVFEDFAEAQGSGLSFVRSEDEALAKLKEDSFDRIVVEVDLSERFATSLQDFLASRPSRNKTLLILGPHDSSLRPTLQASGAIWLDPNEHKIDRSLIRSLLESHAFDRAEYRYSTRQILTNGFALPILEDLRASGRITQDKFSQITLALQEALTNSLEHGNLELDSRWKDEFDVDGVDRYTLTKRKRLEDKRYSDREVVIESELKDGLLYVAIQDQGLGFQSEERDVQRLSSSGLKGGTACSGRGLALIRANMESVEYSDNGRRITLTVRV